LGGLTIFLKKHALAPASGAEGEEASPSGSAAGSNPEDLSLNRKERRFRCVPVLGGKQK